MLNGVVAGIKEAIQAEFGDGYEVYTTQVRQGLKRPCFIVDFVNQIDEHFPSDRHRMLNTFSVRYIPNNTPGAKLECYDAQDRLTGALDFITADGDLLRGVDIHGQMLDGELVFIVNYDYNLRHVEEIPLMETLKIDTAAS